MENKYVLIMFKFFLFLGIVGHVFNLSKQEAEAEAEAEAKAEAGRSLSSGPALSA